MIRNIVIVRLFLMVKIVLNRFFEGNVVIIYRDVVVGFGVNLVNIIEGYYNNVYNWVGGIMIDVVIIVYDLVFILYYIFIDYVWERFR